MSRRFLTPDQIGARNRDNTDKLKPVDPSQISNSIRESMGLEPEEKEVVYESIVDEIIQTKGKPMAEQMYHEAKDIMERIIIQNELKEKYNGDTGENINQNDEHTTKTMEPDQLITNIVVNKVPGPTRRKKK